METALPTLRAFWRFVVCGFRIWRFLMYKPPHLALPHMRLKDCGPSCPCSYGLGPLCPLRERLAEILAESNWKAQQIFQFHSDVRDSLHIFRLQCGGAQYALNWYMPQC